jgi:hypothetical protein
VRSSTIGATVKCGTRSATRIPARSNASSMHAVTAAVRDKDVIRSEKSLPCHRLDLVVGAHQADVGVAEQRPAMDRRTERRQEAHRKVERPRGERTGDVLDVERHRLEAHPRGRGSRRAR